MNRSAFNQKCREARKALARLGTDAAALADRLDPFNLQWLHYFLTRIPDNVARSLLKGYARHYNAGRTRLANSYVRERMPLVMDVLKGTPFTWRELRNDEAAEAIGLKAHTQVRLVMAEPEQFTTQGAPYSVKLAEIYTTLAAIAKEHALAPAAVPAKKVTPEHYEQAILKMSGEAFWTGRMVRFARKARESASICAGMVGKRAAHYLTNANFNDWVQRRRAALEWAELMEVVSEDGDTVKLIDAIEASPANPANRYRELMIRCRGMENAAIQRQWVGDFITITCPSRMHPNSDKYDGTTPKGAQRHLADVWAGIRKRLFDDQTPYSGVRVVEPHVDACPHWHLLLFCAPEHLDAIRGEVAAQALKVDGDEAGAEKHRCAFEAIDPAKGSATGYIAKYIAKNIQGETVHGDSIGEDFETGKDATQTAQRPVAWASLWGLRQFQFFGLPSVTCWRELRRATTKDQSADFGCQLMDAAADAANAGDFTAFIAACGGLALERTKRPIATEYQNEIAETGVYWRKVCGVRSAAAVVATRQKQWAFKRRGSAAPWSPDNNCPGPLSEALADAVSVVFGGSTSHTTVEWLIAGRHVCGPCGRIIHFDQHRNQLRIDQ